jgi:aryl-alcohol dehydrogenase-like predicted oxidoreductase
LQAPFNLAMLELFTGRPENGATVLEVARDEGITVVTSASLLQARLSRGLPDELRNLLPGLDTDAQRALQFARSAPGISVALVGMSSVAHVEQNLALARIPPLDGDGYRRLFQNA